MPDENTNDGVMTNIRPLRRDIDPTQIILLRDADHLLDAIALDNPDLEPAGVHTAITHWRTRYRRWLAHNRHPSRGPDGGAA